MAGSFNTFSSMMRPARRISKRVLISYVLDWVIMIAILGMGGGFHYIEAKGSRHAFSLQDPSLSFPHTDDLVSNPVLYIASVVLPAIIIAAICIIIIPGPASNSSTSSSTKRKWQRKLWELHVGWLGLALSALGAIAITNGLKALAGKPRPHLLAVCNPDLSPLSIARWRVGGLGGLSSTDDITVLATAPIIVTWQICQNTNEDEMKNAFASWPSGHASTSWSGLLYLTLWFMAKFGISFPAPGLGGLFRDRRSNSTSSDNVTSEVRSAGREFSDESAVRSEGSAPPAYLVVLAAVPIGTAFFISISRWFDYRHHGFDIISGAIIGIFCAWVGFYLYQTPFSLGDGWAWTPRPRNTAFGSLVGRRWAVSRASDSAGSVDGGQRGYRMGKVKAESDLESQSIGGSNGANGIELRPTHIAGTSDYR